MPLPQITALDDWTEPISILVYGDPGVGKTVLAQTAPKALLVAVDPGVESARRIAQKTKRETGKASDMKVVRVRTWAEFMGLLKAWRQTDYLARNDIEWIVIDSITELFALCMRGLLDKAHEENKARDLDIPALQDYGKIQWLMKRVLRALNDLPCSMLYLAHAMRHEDENGMDLLLPDIPGKCGTEDPTTMSRWVCGMMQVYGYMTPPSEDGNTGRTLVVVRRGAYFGKDRYDVFGDEIAEPNIAEMQRMIEAPTEGDQ